MKLSGPVKITIAAIALYFIIFSTLAVLKHEAFNSTAFDLGIFDQNIWMFSNGQNLINTVNGFYPFADHVQPILYAIALLYKLAATPILLLIIQAAAISAGAIPLFLLARRKLGEKIAAAFVIAYLLYPPTQYLTLFDFHTEPLMAAFLLLATYFLVTRSTKLMLASLFLAGLTKEYVPVTFIFFAAYMLLAQKRPKAAAISTAIGAAWLLVNYGAILGSYQYNSLHIYYGYYGSSATAQATLTGKIASTLTGLLSIDKLGYAFLMLLPLAGLSLLAPELLALSIPGFALVLLKADTTYKSIVTHHTGFIMPFLFAAAVIGFRRLSALAGEKRRNLIAACMVMLSVASLALYGPFTILYHGHTFNAWSTHAKAGHELLEKIPAEPGVAVSATTWAVPHLSERTRIYMFPAPFKYYGQLPETQLADWFNATPQYVVLDTSRKDIMIDNQLVMQESCNVAKSGSYTVTYDKDGWVLLEMTQTGQDPVRRLC